MQYEMAHDVIAFARCGTGYKHTHAQTGAGFVRLELLSREVHNTSEARHGRNWGNNASNLEEGCRKEWTILSVT